MNWLLLNNEHGNPVLFPLFTCGFKSIHRSQTGLILMWIDNDLMEMEGSIDDFITKLRSQGHTITDLT